MHCINLPFACLVTYLVVCVECSERDGEAG